MNSLIATIILFAGAFPNSPMEANTFDLAGTYTNSPVEVNTFNINSPISYEEILEQAQINCRWARDVNINAELLKNLIQIEKSFNPPEGMRGMLLAAACMESGYNPNAEGDHKFSKKKRPMAIGLLQQWPIYEKMFPGMNRRNPIDAANTWMEHIVRKIPKVKRQCKYKTDDRIWLAAWVTGIRSKKKGGRCKERPLHYRLLKKWHRNIQEQRKEEQRLREPIEINNIKKEQGC